MRVQWPTDIIASSTANRVSTIRLHREIVDHDLRTSGFEIDISFEPFIILLCPLCSILLAIR
jgi:hypothetical protein